LVLLIIWNSTARTRKNCLGIVIEKTGGFNQSWIVTYNWRSQSGERGRKSDKRGKRAGTKFHSTRSYELGNNENLLSRGVTISYTNPRSQKKKREKRRRNEEGYINNRGRKGRKGGNLPGLKRQGRRGGERGKESTTKKLERSRKRP